MCIRDRHKGVRKTGKGEQYRNHTIEPQWYWRYGSFGYQST